MKKIIFIVSIFALINVSVAADTLFRWVDSEGKVHYGDRLEPDAVDVVKKKFGTPAETDDGALSYATRRARQNFPVILYVTEDCGEPCTQAIDLLNKRGIPFAQKTLATKEEINEFKKISGGNKVPAVAIGKTFLNGLEAEQWHDELDIAGYPKSAPVAVRPAVPLSKPAAAEPAIAAPATPTE